MREERGSRDSFEQRLLGELKDVVAQRAGEQAAAPVEKPSPVRRHGPRLAFGLAAVIAAAATLLVLGSGGDNAPRAFAVEPRAGGGVTIEVYTLEDAAGLERALEAAGIRAQVTWLPAGMSCREPHFTPSQVKLPGGGSLGGLNMGGPGEAMRFSIGSTESWRARFGEHRRGEISDEEYYGSLANLNLDPATFRADQSIVLSGSPGPYGGDPEGGFEAWVRVAEGPVGPCEPVAGRSGPRTLLTPADGKSPGR